MVCFLRHDSIRAVSEIKANGNYLERIILGTLGSQEGNTREEVEKLNVHFRENFTHGWMCSRSLKAPLLDFGMRITCGSRYDFLMGI